MVVVSVRILELLDARLVISQSSQLKKNGAMRNDNRRNTFHMVIESFETHCALIDTRVVVVVVVVVEHEPGR
ncbi:hypothetical protein ElyMa_006170500 [Elysia marginata]|uniref:Secreted protein n=1 Tax=Elysia marginata TaxID=1093978 RepID=A0AAV4H0Y5_9GAST|nr:hypothetical protein ElyMa_006170500 [Elysia marginata]